MSLQDTLKQILGVDDQQNQPMPVSSSVTSIEQADATGNKLPAGVMPASTVPLPATSGELVPVTSVPAAQASDISAPPAAAATPPVSVSLAPSALASLFKTQVANQPATHTSIIITRITNDQNLRNAPHMPLDKHVAAASSFRNASGQQIGRIFPEADARLMQLFSQHSVIGEMDKQKVALTPSDILITSTGNNSAEYVTIKVKLPNVGRIGVSRAGNALFHALEQIPELANIYDFKKAEATVQAAQQKPEELCAAFSQALESNPSAFTTTEKEGLVAWFAHESKLIWGNSRGAVTSVATGQPVTVNFDIHAAASKDGVPPLQVCEKNIEARKQEILAHIVAEATQQMQEANGKFAAEHKDQPPPFSAEHFAELKKLDLVIGESVNEWGKGVQCFLGVPKPEGECKEVKTPQDRLGPTVLAKLDNKALDKIICHAVFQVGKDASSLIPLIAGNEYVKDMLKAKVGDVPALSSFLEGSPFTGREDGYISASTEENKKPIPCYNILPEQPDELVLTLDCPKGTPATDLIKAIAAYQPGKTEESSVTLPAGSFAAMVKGMGAEQRNELLKALGAAPVGSTGVGIN